MNELLTSRDVQKMLKISRGMLWAITSGRRTDVPPLPVVRIGRRQLFRRESIEEWLRMAERKGACSADRSKS